MNGWPARCYNHGVDFVPAIELLFQKIVREANGRSVVSVQFVLGEIADLDQDTLKRHWRECAAGTSLERAGLHIRLVPAEVQCMACFSKYHPVNKQILCPSCGSYGAKILSGEEFRLESVEVDYE